MKKVIVVALPDGSVEVIRPSESFRLAGESDDAFVERVRKRDAAGDSFVMNETDLPDRSQRANWRASNGRVVVVEPALTLQGE